MKRFIWALACVACSAVGAVLGYLIAWPGQAVLAALLFAALFSILPLVVALKGGGRR